MTELRLWYYSLLTPTPPVIRSIKIEFHLTNAGEFRPLCAEIIPAASDTHQCKERKKCFLTQ